MRHSQTPYDNPCKETCGTILRSVHDALQREHCFRNHILNNKSKVPTPHVTITNSQPPVNAE
jgi:hypothetical protein